MQWLAVALGGALGSMLRYAATLYLVPLWGSKFPFATFAVNMLGSFLIGAAYVLLVETWTLTPPWRLFFITGILGGFTTFSAFSLETLQLWQQGQVAPALLYAASSLLLGLLLAYAGMALTQKLF